MVKLTRFEVTRLISARAVQLALGAPQLVQAEGNISMEDIAKLELKEKVLPLSVLRQLPTGQIQRIEVM